MIINDTPEYEFAHEGYCNAGRNNPVGCGGCSCRAGREIKRLRKVLDDLTAFAVAQGWKGGAIDEANKILTERN